MARQGFLGVAMGCILLASPARAELKGLESLGHMVFFGLVVVVGLVVAVIMRAQYRHSLEEVPKPEEGPRPGATAPDADRDQG